MADPSQATDVDPSGAAPVTVLVRITGRVQRVWFRGWILEQAQRRRLAGWVRNRADGAVEALFSGGAADVETMLAACWQGPPAARVVDVQSLPASPPEGCGFYPRPTV